MIYEKAISLMKKNFETLQLADYKNIKMIPDFDNDIVQSDFEDPESSSSSSEVSEEESELATKKKAEVKKFLKIKK